MQTCQKGASFVGKAVIFARWTAGRFFPGISQQAHFLETIEQGVEGSFYDNDAGGLQFFDEVGGIHLASGDDQQDAVLKDALAHLDGGVLNIHGMVLWVNSYKGIKGILLCKVPCAAFNWFNSFCEFGLLQLVASMLKSLILALCLKPDCLENFSVWFETGMWHIADPMAYDHILFLMALCGFYTWQNWKGLLVLVTAFTLGHSLTLALSVLNIVALPAAYIEFAIPLSIVLTCAYNLGHLAHRPANSEPLRYGMAALFGLVHGLGFSYLLKAMLGSENDLLLPLFAFNVGLEAGQLLIVVALLLAGSLAQRLRVKERDWRLSISTFALGIALTMTLDRIPQ